MPNLTLSQLILQVRIEVPIDRHVDFRAHTTLLGRFDLLWVSPSGDHFWLVTARGAPRTFKTLDACWSVIRQVEAGAQREGATRLTVTHRYATPAAG